jgi:hypothetical protein
VPKILGSTRQDAHVLAQSKLFNHLAEELASSDRAVHQNDPSFGPDLTQDESRKSAAGSKVNHAGGGVDSLCGQCGSEPAGMLDLEVEGCRPEKAERSTSGQDLSYVR